MNEPYQTHLEICNEKLKSTFQDKLISRMAIKIRLTKDIASNFLGGKIYFIIKFVNGKFFWQNNSNVVLSQNIS